MVKRIAVAIALTVGMVSAAAAHGHRHAAAQYRARHHHQWGRIRHGRHYAGRSQEVAGPLGSNAAEARAEGLPWCGAYMADLFGIGGARGRELWLARSWASEGRATRPHDGAVVVWAHHVGRLVSHVVGDIWLVLSGNDGHRVRERARSISGAIAFRDI